MASSKFYQANKALHIYRNFYHPRIHLIAFGCMRCEYFKDLISLFLISNFFQLNINPIIINNRFLDYICHGFKIKYNFFLVRRDKIRKVYN